ncbi:hypothetical protein ES703_112026 [subsurface metagenome]
MRKIFLLLVIIIVLLTLVVSCKPADAQAKIDELEAKIAELEKAQAEQKPEGEEESPTTEALEEKPEKEFSPTIAGSLYISGQTAAVYVIGDCAYAAGQGLKIIDITDKNNPTIVSTADATGWALDFYVEGNYAYLPYTSWDNEGYPSGGGFKIIDITDKKKPTEVGIFESDGEIGDIGILENYIYASYEVLEEQDEGYYNIVESGIKIIDMTGKENPVSVGIYDTGESGRSPVCIEGDYAYIFVGQTLKILDITDRENPTDIGSYISSGGWVRDLCVVGDYAYLPSSNSLQIIDISDKENPIMAGGAFAPGGISYGFVEGDYAYITYVVTDANWQVKESGMQIIDVKDKNAPTVVTGVEIPGEAAGIFVEGDYAYVGAGPVGLHILKLYAD